MSLWFPYNIVTRPIAPERQPCFVQIHSDHTTLDVRTSSNLTPRLRQQRLLPLLLRPNLFTQHAILLTPNPLLLKLLQHLPLLRRSLHSNRLRNLQQIRQYLTRQSIRHTNLLRPRCTRMVTRRLVTARATGRRRRARRTTRTLLRVRAGEVHCHDRLLVLCHVSIDRHRYRWVVVFQPH